MSQQEHIPEPQRLAEQPETATGLLLRHATRLEPPSGLKERIWRRLSEPTARLAEAQGESPAVVAALRSAADIEPPAGAQNRIWNRLLEQQAVRQGAEPRRLMETDDFVAGLLARAAEREPAYGKQARIYRAVKDPAPKPVRWQFPVGLLGAAAMAVMLLHFRPVVPVAPPPAAPAMASLSLTVPAAADLKLVHTSPVSGPVSLAQGDTLVVGASGTARVQAAGVGDMILGQAGTSLRLLESDAKGVHLELAEGRISMHADKRRRTAPLVIHAQGAEVQIVGTIFSVETSESGPHVYVREGLVQVRFGGDTAMVGAGQWWPATEKGIAPWAASAMETLDNTKPAAHPVTTAVVKPDASVVKPHTKRAPERQKTNTEAEEPISHASPAAVNVGTVSASNEPVVRMKPLSVHFEGQQGVLAGIDLTSGVLASKPATLEELNEIRSQLANNGTENLTEKIRLNKAIIGLNDPSAPPAQLTYAKRIAMRDLSDELESKGAIREAADLRMRLAADPALRPDTRAHLLNQALADLVLLNDTGQGIRLVDANAAWMPTVPKAGALVFQSLLYANQGNTAASEKSLKTAVALDNAAVETAVAVLNDFRFTRAQYRSNLGITLETIVNQLHDVNTSGL